MAIPDDNDDILMMCFELIRAEAVGHELDANNNLSCMKGISSVSAGYLSFLTATAHSHCAQTKLIIEVVSLDVHLPQADYGSPFFMCLFLDIQIHVTIMQARKYCDASLGFNNLIINGYGA